MMRAWRYCSPIAGENLCSGGLRRVAKQIIHKLVDDLDGGDAEETVKFALDGIQYEIDLSDKNATKLRELFDPYGAAGAKIARGGVVVGGRAAHVRVEELPQFSG